MAEVVPSAQLQFSPGRYFIKLNYQRESRLHSQRISVAGATPGGGVVGASLTAFNGWSFDVEGNTVNTPVNAQTAVDALVDELRKMLPSNASYIDATLYDQPTAGDRPMPMATREFTGKVGTGTPPNIGDLRVIKTTLSFRTAAFSRMKIVLIESVYPIPVKLRGTAALLPGVDTLVSYILGSAGSWIVGADGSRPTAFLSFATTEDNGLRARYF